MWFAGNRRRLQTLLQVAVRCVCGVVTALCPLALLYNHQTKDIVKSCWECAIPREGQQLHSSPHLYPTL